MMRLTSPARGGSAIASTIRELFALGQPDYYLDPIILADENDRPIGRITNGDSVIFCCRRGEREIQLTDAFTNPDFGHFPRPDLSQLTFAILTLYHEKFNHLPIAFAPVKGSNTLGEIVSRAGLRQMRVAESEKFAHVTIFLNGRENQPFPGEDDVYVPSPKDVPFEEVPGLSLPGVCLELERGIREHYDLIVTNFANGDVIGHTENNPAKIECARIVDRHLGQIIEAAVAEEYLVMVTADHGNLEVMLKPDGSPHVAHTANPVPFILIDPASSQEIFLRDGRLADIAPTVLSAFGLKVPAAMGGSSLAPDHDWGESRRVLLIILDGWGLGSEDDSNPIFLAETPVFDDLMCSHSNSCLDASGESVGLQAGKAGNSEAGHMNIGAGQVILQDDVRLDLSMKDGSFYRNPVFVKVLEDVKKKNSNLHLIALLTKKSSHGSVDYPLALLRMAQECNLDQVFLHLIFDGRSTEPGSAPDLVLEFEQQIDEIGLGQIVSGVGRGLALDRDGNYAKTRKAFDAFVAGKGNHSILD
jgi:2,3-bisphosphoglycerate-independent phosphoglycerate mutase